MRRKCLRDEVDMVAAEGADDHADHDAIEGDEHGVEGSCFVDVERMCESPVYDGRA